MNWANNCNNNVIFYWYPLCEYWVRLRTICLRRKTQYSSLSHSRTHSPKMDIKMQKLFIATGARIQSTHSSIYSVCGWFLIACYHVAQYCLIWVCALSGFLSHTHTHTLFGCNIMTTAPHHLLLSCVVLFCWTERARKRHKEFDHSAGSCL